MNHGFFITGTDTDAGKTLVSAWLRYHTGYGYWKPIQSGASSDCDTSSVAALTSPLAPSVKEKERIYTPTYTFQAYSSPEFAARQEGKEILLDKIQLPTSGPLLVEGAGGIMVPLSPKLTVLDLIQFLGLPVIVVARNKLGVINHTCLTLRVLQSTGVPVKGVVLSGDANLENEKAIERLSGFPILQTLPHFSAPTGIHAHPLSKRMTEIFS